MKQTKSTLAVKQIICAAIALFLLGAGTPTLAVQPDVNTVPWVATNPLIPHTTWSGNQVTLKGTSDVQGPNFEYSWDFGDGSPPAVGTVTNRYVVEALHTYTCGVGDVFSARLTIEDKNTGDTASQAYFVQCEPEELASEVNVAIDEGLWYLHKSMIRADISGLPGGYWPSTYGAYPSVVGQNVSAFLVNGHLPNGSADNPYVETVQRGLRRMLNTLGITTGISSQTNPNGTFDPDANGNGCAVFSSYGSNYFYQSGMIMDALVATGLQNEVVDVPPFTTTNCSGPGQTNNGSWTYADVVQDYADYISYCQYDNAPQGGGWRYNCNEAPDGSAVQWAAIGLIAGEWHFGTIVPQPVKDFLKVWTDYGHDLASGRSGYTSSTYYPWGPYATTPSGTVQMVYNGQGRGDPLWDSSEGFLRSNWCNTSTSAAGNIKQYYYGLFSFSKSMLLHDSNGDGVSEPIECLGGDVDWYAGEAGNPSACNASEPCNGIARTLVNDQLAAGNWTGNDYSSAQFAFDTGWAIVMLNRTVFASGTPVAVAQATPNPGVAGQTIVLDGSGSFHQDASKTIDSWEWDLDNDGVYDVTGPSVTTSFGALGDYPVTLRVTDDASPEASDTTVVTVRITTPPLAPTADADGPYVFCPQAQPWFLDGTGSVNPDEGLSEPGQPGDTIQQYAWELDGLDADFDEASGATPDVTAFFTAQGTGNYLIQLRVTDTTATSFPSSGFGDLSDTDSSQVSVKDAADQACSCINDLAARPKSGKVQLTWTHTGAVSYNVYRSTTAGGPYVLIANTTSTYSTYLDTGLTNGVTYYYVVREAALNGDELCQSNEANATPVARTRRR